MRLNKTPAHEPRWFWIPLRVLLVTFLLILLTFAVSLLLGIAGIVAGARLRGVPANLTVAYRHIAAPIAAVAGVIALVSVLTMELGATVAPRRWRASGGLGSPADRIC